MIVLNEKKEKYLNIFNYLREFANLRSKPIRDIDAEGTHYSEKRWFADIPDDKLIENIVRPCFDSENDYWLKLRKPQEPAVPKFAELPKHLQDWIDKDSLLNEKGPVLKESIELDGDILHINDYPEFRKEFEEYIKKDWRNDLVEYQSKLETYAIELRRYDELNKVYKFLFQTYNKSEQFGEEYELVVGVGLLNYKANNDSPRIYRHLFTQKVDIYFETVGKDSVITVSPGVESAPKLETEFIIDLPEQFDPSSMVNAAKVVENFIREESIDTVFTRPDEFLQVFADRLTSDSSYLHEIKKPSQNTAKPTVTYAPALILRRRNTRSLTELYNKIIDKINSADDDLEIPSMDDLLGFVPTVVEATEFSEVSFVGEQDQALYFPKEWNDEQLQIIQRIRSRKKVLVQGPPGTGKSHTIANLICHLLADGKKVLITAHTKRALEVLKNKLPDEFKSLVVSLLSGDSSSIEELDSSVNKITSELSRANLNDYNDRIQRTELQLKQTREKIAETTNELLIIKEKSVRRIQLNDNYEGSLMELAEAIERDTTTYEWYKDQYAEADNALLIAKLSGFVDVVNIFRSVETGEFAYEIPDPARLLTPKQFAEYVTIKDEFDKKFSGVTLPDKIDCNDYERLEGLLNQLQKTYEKADRISLNFKKEFVEDFASGKKAFWIAKMNLTKEILIKYEATDFRAIDRDIHVTYPEGKNLIQLKNDARILSEYLAKGHLLSGLSFSLRRPFLPREIRERLYFLNAVLVNGSPCNTKAKFDIVLNDIKYRQDFSELATTWGVEEFEDNSLSQKYRHFRQLLFEVEGLWRLVEDALSLKKTISSLSNLNITLFDIEEITKALLNVQYSSYTTKLSKYDDVLKKSNTYLSEDKLHPIKVQIKNGYAALDPYKYANLIENLQNLISRKNQYLQFLEMRRELCDVLPMTINLVENDIFRIEHIDGLKQAILFRNAQRELQRYMGEEYEEILLGRRRDLEQLEKRLIAKLASKKAWYHLLNALKENRALHQHLSAWAMAVKRIGKTGTGKRASRFRKIAQEQMEHCKDAIPCWIMPLYKAAETIEPSREMFDYVIVDEASQLGPDALFLLYLSKKIIIVGDDLQTSPEYVGIEESIMVPHIKRYLEGIPFSKYYGTEFSFFDHAKIFCGEDTIVLREHFRCMPEIIEFSNRYFYMPENKELYPLKQYSEDRLEPLISVFCPNGYTDGTHSNIINEPEATLLVETIARLVKDKQYNGKTFGVISLQGTRQVSLIEDLLLKTIGDKEFFKRKIICGNSASFQGDERDIMFLSLVTAQNHRRAALTSSQDRRRFNVAVSRAKEQVFLFHSVQLSDFSNTDDLRYKLLDHVQNYRTAPTILNTPIERKIGSQPHPFESWFEVDVYNEIVRRQLKVIPNYEVARGRYRIDMVMLLPNGTKIAIECDGDRWHGPEAYQKDLMRQRVLERCGWQFFRVRGYEYYANRHKALEPLWAMIDVLSKKQPVPISETHVAEPDTGLVVHPISSSPALSGSNDAASAWVPLVKSGSRLGETLETEERGSETETSFDVVEPDVDDVLESGVVSRDEEINSEDAGPVEEGADELVIGDDTKASKNNDPVLRYFNLFLSGDYIMTDDSPLTHADYVVPIFEKYRNGYLLQCYRSGHVNKVYVSVLLGRKIGKTYLNGLNREGMLTDIKVVESEQILGVFFTENGQRKFKGHRTENISTRELLHLQGIKVVYNDFEDIEYHLLPREIDYQIDRLVFGSFQAGGKAVSNGYYNKEWELINNYIRKR